MPQQLNQKQSQKRSGSQKQFASLLAQTRLYKAAVEALEKRQYFDSPQLADYMSTIDNHEGNAEFHLYYTDSDDDAVGANVDYGDGQSEWFDFGGGGGGVDFQHYYSDQGATISVTVFDSQGGSTSSWTIDNAAPTANFNEVTTYPGVAVTLALTNVTDRSDDDLTQGLKYGFATDSNQLPTSYSAASDINAYTFSANESGDYTVYSIVYDKDDGPSQYTTTVHVIDPAPTAEIRTNFGAVYEGSGATVYFQNVLDPQTLSVAYVFGRNLAALPTDYNQVSNSTSPTAVITLPDDGPNVIWGRVINSAGYSNSYAITIAARNVAPTLSVTGQAASDEGSSYTLTLGYSDPGDDPVTAWIVDWGDGVREPVSGTGSPTTKTHVYTKAGIHSILAAAFDGDGTFAAAPLKLDTTFGTGGKTVTNFNIALGATEARAIGPDGKIVVVGYLHLQDTLQDKFAIARYLPNGSPDPTFGTSNDGTVINDIGGSADAQNSARAVQILPNGKILVAGSSPLSRQRSA